MILRGNYGGRDCLCEVGMLVGFLPATYVDLIVEEGIVEGEFIGIDSNKWACLSSAHDGYVHCA
jgi:hypothetical protein